MKESITRRSAVAGTLAATRMAAKPSPYFPEPDSRGGWRTANTKRQAQLDRLFDYIGKSTSHGGLLAVHRGWLVYERYFGLGAREATPNLASVGKAVTSIAAGILIQEQPKRFPGGLDQKVCTPDYLPPEAFPLSDPRRAGIKLGHLLAMSAGLLGNHPGYVSGNPVTLDPPGPDGWKALLDEAAFTVPLWRDPGGGYSYATTSPHLASIVIRTVSGMELSDFVRARLAGPLGWSAWAYGHKNRPLKHTPGGGGICLRPTDLLRFGYLLCRGGMWGERRILSADFVEACGRTSPFNPHYPYSLQFHVNTDGQIPDAPRDAYWKPGAGGHCLYIVPSMDLVAFKMGGRDDQYETADTGLPPSAPGFARSQSFGRYHRSADRHLGNPAPGCGRVSLGASLRLFWLALLPLSLVHAEDVHAARWDTVELTFRGGRYANPFRDARISAVFTHQSGRSIGTEGFFDGDQTWRIRFMPLETGRWSYSTRSSDPALNGRSGAVIADKPPLPYLHGPLRADGLHFIHADGTRPFLVSARLSCQFADPQVWPGVLSFLNSHRINRVLFMIGGINGQFPELYGPDLWSYNLARFQAVDRFIDALRTAGILASPYFYYFNDLHQRRLTPEQDEQFIRYGMARWGAYANLAPVLANEVEQKSTGKVSPSYDLSSHAWANRMGTVLKSAAVFGVPVAVHNPMETRVARNPGFFSLLLDWPFRWAAFQLRQMQVGALGAAAGLDDQAAEPNDPVYNARAFARHNELLIGLRRFGVPVINEEPGYEMEGTHPWNSQSAHSMRQTFWTAAAAGAYAMWGSAATYELGDPLPAMRRSRVPGYLKTLAGTMTSLPFWEMEPANGIVDPRPEVVDNVPYRTNFALGKAGSVYLVYSREGGQVKLTPPPGRYRLSARQLVSIAPAAAGPDRWETAFEVTREKPEYPVDLRVAYDWILTLRRD
ncbi:MAG TPA: DUF5060 domain-containing protein [Bryobacteraceae bacterium]|nr:DUF5060 domain-containing protein [Bryobacteraceae bacterium]